MRKIDKSKKIPPSLLNAPVPGNSKEVKEAIYKADDVRTQLCEDQHDKCAYCECDLTKQYNDVEHYRPKSIYYWLGHDWNNLLYACDLCNRTYKNDSFPLKNPTKRVTTPGDLSGEEPLIINPADEDPANNIKFNRHIMVGITDKGDKTIELFHLNDRDKRPELLNNRQQLYELYEIELSKIAISQKMLQLQGLTQEMTNELLESIRLCQCSINRLKSPSQAYSGMLI